MTRLAVATLCLALSACASVPRSAAVSAIEVQILAINDFHGNLERPEAPIRVQLGSDTFATMRAGGAAILGAELAKLRSGRPHSVTVAAGDLIGASPLTSAYFMDEPTIDAMNLIGLDLASVGNHEFDKGSAELLRMQNGGCDKYTTRVPCRVELFKGAKFQYLGANVVKADGMTLFPAAALRRFGPVTIGFIGMTLKDTGRLVTPAGVAGLTFADEAATANALVPWLKAQGADTIVLLIHQGGRTPDPYRLKDCAGLTGDILPILDHLDPAIATVVSGHTHVAYACELERGGAQRLLTSAGKYGYLVSDIRLSFDPTTHRLLGQRAVNVPVVGDGQVQPAVDALVKRYVTAVSPAASRVVGRLPGPLPKAIEGNGESAIADLIADAQLAATRAANRGGAELSFINSGGVRTDLRPAADGSVTYAQIFALQPFGNNLVVKTLTGAQLAALLEQQFVDKDGVAALGPSILIPSVNFRFSYDLAYQKGQRVRWILLDGQPIRADRAYRVVVNNFLASGGDGYSVLAEGRDAFDAGLDLDALEAWLATNPVIPEGDRVTDLTRR